MAHDAEVVVVGAGLSGLAAARELVARGHDVRVLEARERVGGRTLSQPFGEDVIDLGGQWVGPDQRRTLRLIEALGLETFPQRHEGKKVLMLGGERRVYRGTIPRVDLASLLVMQGTLTRLERLRQKVSLDAPWESARAEGWDAETLASWMGRNVPARGARALLEIATRAIFACEPSELSFLHFLFYLNSGGGLMRLAEVEGGAQERRIAGGAQQLAKGMAAALGERVVLGAPVSSIRQDAAGVRVESGARRWRARRVIVALPPALAGRIAYAPALPAARDQLTQRVPMGAAIKCVAAYERPFWRERGFSGEAVSDAGPVRLVFDDTSHDGRQAALVGFFLGHSALRYSGQPAERRRVFLERLAAMFGAEARRPALYVDQDWPAERHSRGCYVGVFGPGTWTGHGAALRKPVGAVHWAGTETAREWCGYFEGALEAGERAASEVARALGE